MISFTHIYRELNEEVDNISKQGLLLDLGFLLLEEQFDGVSTEIRQALLLAFHITLNVFFLIFEKVFEVCI